MQTASSSERFVFDISAILDYVERTEHYSGIQRVIVSLLAEFVELAPGDDVLLAYVDRRTGKYMCFPYEQLGRDAFLSPRALRARFFPARKCKVQLEAFDRYKARPGKLWYHQTRLDLAAQLGRERPFRRYNLTVDMWREARGMKTPGEKPEPPIESVPLSEVAKPGDHLLLLDSSWAPRHAEAFLAAKEAGLIVHTFVHDLIPLVSPDTVDVSFSEIFHDWLLGSAAYTSRYIANSQSTGNDLRYFLDAYGIDKVVGVVPLAQAGVPQTALAPWERQDGPLSRKIKAEAYPYLSQTVGIRADIRQTVSVPYVLCVGTIEARKNTWRTIAAWKKLLEAGHYDVPRLVFAGRRGWMRSDFDDILAGTGNLYGWVRVVEGPTDRELDYLYRHCQFSVMASLYEGWGLPVGEALSYGKTSVVGTTGALPEVGGDLVEYCDPASIESIAGAVWRLCSDPVRRTELEDRIAATKLRSWSDVAADLRRAVLD
ncbi:glycosyltransferase family 4 protein [Acidimangrovimonas sediminis]|uniref:glycosyltransferase family 4 protein n=1 Tax=Acidimangrovimonas sediminis TaxID=2056283 RepID=UPI000C8045A8|nr:glycosyltransferase family 1 protein [Acidimangrovimonas sediminis]